MIGRLEELARKLGDRGDEVIADFYMGKIGYQEALKKTPSNDKDRAQEVIYLLL